MNLFFLDSERNFGGVERWMLTTARNFRDRGHVSYFGGRHNSLFLKRCAEGGFETFGLNIKGDFSLTNTWRLSRLFKKHQIDVLITNQNKDVRLGGIAGKLSTRPVVVARNGLPIIGKNWRYRLTYRWLVDGIITPNHAIRDHYLTFGWIPPDYVRVIHNGIDCTQPVNFDRAAILHKHGVPDKGPLLGIFGRLVPQKQHAIFLEIARNVLNEWPEANFLIVGDGPLRKDIQKYATELGIMDHLYMLGFQKEVLELYSVCDLVLQTSEHEGLPNVVLEAMFTARPVISFDTGGTRELILNDQIGIVLPLNDIYLMTQKTLELLNDSPRRKSMGERAKAFIHENFSLEKMVNGVEIFIKELRRRRNGESANGS